MNKIFETKIVEQRKYLKQFNRLSSVVVLFGGIYFLYTLEYNNLAIIIIFSLMIFLNLVDFLQPKLVGSLQFFEDCLEVHLNDQVFRFKKEELVQVVLRYKGHGGWLSTNAFHGENNHLAIKSDNRDLVTFQFMLKNEEVKNEFKSILYNKFVTEDNFKLVKLGRSDF